MAARRRPIWETATRVLRRSLQWRVVAASMALSTLALVGVFGYMSLSVGQNLFETRRDEALVEAVRASGEMQQIFDEAVTATLTSGEVDALQDRALDAVTGLIASRTSTEYAMLRSDRQGETLLQMNDVQSQAFDTDLLSSELRASVASASDTTPYYQSVRLEQGGSSEPAIVVGTTVDVPLAGRYELYLQTSLQSTQATLGFMQLTMVLGGLALIALIGLITWFVARMVVGPVQQAADSAARIAAGELDVRIPVRGDDEVATLGRSFNDMADSIEVQINELATLSTVQQRFVSDVSHELRTPLTTIKLAGDVLHDRREAFDPVAGRTVELLHTQIERFERLLADLLELSRFDARAAQLEIEPTNLVRLAQGEISALEPLAAERGSELRLVAPGGHFEAEVDPRRIRRILQNLLGNAIDHGEGHPIVVTVDSSSDAAAIAVRDHGVGMTEEEASRVFDRFWRADPSRQRRTGGTGLGLSISRDDAALHGGWIDVWSRPGEGTAFRLTLPRAGARTVVSPIDLPPAEAPPPAEPARAADEDMASAPIALVDPATRTTTEEVER
ncbi:MtrAB system histidine kinase MtrB [Agrococcus sp. Marseille-Q4369]|uniref:MtrAB system histidine kinase MtrB n=1 Tax=Agrococcus sp. Marseille-Q4369 TaxID=2810513 RepID=UPI001B8BC6E5|nr:MtrAB system histidine kinase MtrB [Agrococcus sp. Marseille-Q4369]QUW19748.1 HAMP domain-containing histidine kinase [Agrococcus sp. Marseille-Q4369]